MLLRRLLLRRAMEGAMGCGVSGQQLCGRGPTSPWSAGERDGPFFACSPGADLWRNSDEPVDLGVDPVFSNSASERRDIFLVAYWIRSVPAGNTAISR